MSVFVTVLHVCDQYVAGGNACAARQTRQRAFNSAQSPGCVVIRINQARSEQDIFMRVTTACARVVDLQGFYRSFRRVANSAGSTDRVRPPVCDLSP